MCVWLVYAAASVIPGVCCRAYVAEYSGCELPALLSAGFIDNFLYFIPISFFRNRGRAVLAAVSLRMDNSIYTLSDWRFDEKKRPVLICCIQLIE